MAKTKLHRYERVQHLSNVTFSVFGQVSDPCTYPWYQPPFAGMEKILELGCGKGEHSLAFAAADPAKCCVGIDSKSHRMCIGAEKAIAAGLENVHFLRARIERIHEFFKKQSITEIWLTFPDPNLKKRKIKNRLSAPSFLDAYARLLVPEGTVHLKTDSDRFCAYTRESVEQWGGRVVLSSENIHAGGKNFMGPCDTVSAFEKAARSQGKPIKYMVFTLTR